MRLLSFIRWSTDAGWEDTFYVLLYPIKTWRCRLFGHDWGPEESDYDPNIGAKMQSWQNCRRKNCDGWHETFHYATGECDRVFG